MKIFETVADMKAARLNEGRVSCKRRIAGGPLLNLIYEVKSTGTADGFIDHETANGYIAELVHDSVISVKHAGAVGDGSTDDTASIQACLNSNARLVYFPAGRYGISSTLIGGNDQLLKGDVAGAYFQGTGYERGSVILPLTGFTGTDVVRFDPSDTSAGAVYRFGLGMEHLTIDLDNVASEGLTTLNLQSVTNAETFSNLRLANNDTGIQLKIGKSNNASALESDGLKFDNLILIYKTGGIVTSNPLVLIESANEISFTDTKFLGPNASTQDTYCVHIKPTANNTVNSVVFYHCSFTGMDVGTCVESVTNSSQGPRWIRWNDCTFEGPRFPVKTLGVVSRPVQFLNFNRGNRWQTTRAGGYCVNLGEYTSNSHFDIDDFLPTGATGNIILAANANSNIVYAAPSTVSNAGSNNIIIGRDIAEQVMLNSTANSVSRVEATDGFGAQRKYKTDSAEYSTTVFGSLSANSGKMRWSKGNDNCIEIDGNTTAGQTRLLIYDVDNGTLERVSVGTADSGGAGFKLLRIPN